MNSKQRIRRFRTERRWTFLDKRSWPAGPWRQEPDKSQWVDEPSGLDCLIVRGPSGSLCGYVGVPESHPLFQRDGEELFVHGGITFTNFCQESPPGFPNHQVCRIPFGGRPEKVWWFGFDCAHSRDASPLGQIHLRSVKHVLGSDAEALFRQNQMWPCGVYRNFHYVRRQCASLAAQLAAIEVNGYQRHAPVQLTQNDRTPSHC